MTKKQFVTNETYSLIQDILYVNVIVGGVVRCDILSHCGKATIGIIYK